MHRRFALSMLFVLASPLAAGAEVNRSWDTLVQTVKVGKKVVVTRMNSATAEGKLLSITADSVSVELDKKPMTIEKSNVFRLRYADIRKKRTLIGLTIGAVAGGIIGAASGASDDSAGLLAAVGAIWGVGLGSLGGAVIPIGPPLYESARPPGK